MRVKTNPSRCDGYASCAIIAPSIFDLDDSGRVLVVSEPTEGDRAVVEEAVRACPAMAIWIEED